MTFRLNYASLRMKKYLSQEGAQNMKTAQDLRTLLQSIDHKSYPAYKSTQGIYRFPG